MSGWYIAAVVVLLLGLGTAFLLGGSCPELACSAIQVSPIVGVFASMVVAGVLSFIGFIRSTR
jgi:hypothetical protein